jgi:hypothetical protein
LATSSGARQAALGWGIRKQLPPPLVCISTEHNVCTGVFQFHYLTQLSSNV